MFGCESWTIKKAVGWRIDAFELWCWKFLRVPWTARRFNHSILKEISPEYSLEGLMLKVKLNFGHMMWRTDSFEKTVMLGKFEGERRRGQQRMASPTQWIWVWASSRSWWWIGGLVCCSPWGLKESDMIEQLNWTKLNTCYNINEPCKHYVKWKKPVTKGHILYDSIYVKFPE